MTSLTDIGGNLVAGRVAAGISQRELGERIGVKQQQIARWEASGYRTATLERIAGVADALGVGTAEVAAEARAAYGVRPAGQALAFDYRALVTLCREHGIAKLELFGSVLRDDFGADSDVDMLVTFEADIRVTISTLLDVGDHLAVLLGRPVDLTDRRAIERSGNPLRRELILGSARTLYGS